MLALIRLFDIVNCISGQLYTYLFRYFYFFTLFITFSRDKLFVRKSKRNSFFRNIVLAQWTLLLLLVLIPGSQPWLPLPSIFDSAECDGDAFAIQRSPEGNRHQCFRLATSGSRNARTTRCTSPRIRLEALSRSGSISRLSLRLTERILPLLGYSLRACSRKSRRICVEGVALDRHEGLAQPPNPFHSRTRSSNAIYKNRRGCPFDDEREYAAEVETLWNGLRRATKTGGCGGMNSDFQRKLPA